MTVQIEILESFYLMFAEFVERHDKKTFLTFKASSYIDKEENYKYSVYEEARGNLGSKWWKTGDIGRGKILQDVNAAIKTKVNHNYQTLNNNLIDWRKKDNFAKIGKNENIERTLFDFYKSKISDQQAFEVLLYEKLSYQFIAYLFFIKDFGRFMPISQERFDRIFEQLGLVDFKTSGNAAWENYLTFNNIIKQVRDFLRIKDAGATLLDAHSFLWILGNQMKQANSVPANISSVKLELTVTIPANPKLEIVHLIVEEDDELSFPEGKEIFRLHKLKERSTELTKAAKQNRLQTDGKLSCQVCSFSFVDKYGELGEGFIEAHHIYPISELTEETETKIEDIALVCSNCHRMLHRKRPWSTLAELKSLNIGFTGGT